jgi:hypothetical protein
MRQSQTRALPFTGYSDLAFYAGSVQSFPEETSECVMA